MTAQLTPPIEKPKNGLAGLKHWRYDLLAGFVVSLVSLPLSSGIAIASGAPPIYGIISSIIAGLVFPFVRGSFVTIAGPAAGLAPALLATMAALGGAGTADSVGAGYPLLLVVIFIVGILQVIMAKMGVARFAGIFPSSVVEGMLGAIGLLILVKALPLYFGVLNPGHPHGFFEYVGAIPGWWHDSLREAFIIGTASLATLFLVSLKAVKNKWRVFAIVPPHIFAVVVGIALSLFFGLKAINPTLLIQVPANPLSSIQFPAFSTMLSHSELWKAALIGIVTLTLVDGVESLATAQAIDRIDPFQRKSNPNRLLAAMGISNIISSLAGGLTIIPGGVKSKTCIEAGGRTLWANFVNAFFLLIFLFIAPTLIALIPKAALGAVLIFTGWKMIEPNIAKHLAEVGREQIVLYVLTILCILATDLLVGVLLGTAAKFLFLAFNAIKVSKQTDLNTTGGQALLSLFKSPVSTSEVIDHKAIVTIERPLVCFNAYLLHEHIASLDHEVKDIHIRVGHQTALIDHTACDSIFALVEASNANIVIDGLEDMRSTSQHRKSMKIRDSRLWKKQGAAVAMAAGALLATTPEPNVEVEEINGNKETTVDTTQ